MRYLKGTSKVGITYRNGGSDFNLVGYSDADFANDVETRRSTTGYIFELSNGPITWCSQRQKSVALSTTVAEYIAACEATKEATWLRLLLNDIGCQCTSPTIINIDNQSSIKLVKNPEFHKRTKHVDTRYHFIREKYQERAINVCYVPSELQLADILTKALPREVTCIGPQTSL